MSCKSIDAMYCVYNMYVDFMYFSLFEVPVEEAKKPVCWADANKCIGCGRDYDTVPQGKICPYCGSGETWPRTGNEVNATEIAIV